MGRVRRRGARPELHGNDEEEAGEEACARPCSMHGWGRKGRQRRRAAAARQHWVEAEGFPAALVAHARGGRVRTAAARRSLSPRRHLPPPYGIEIGWIRIAS